VGLDFTALIHYDGPTGDVLRAIARLERGEEDAEFARVTACGLRRDFAFASDPGRQALWRSFDDYEQVLPVRPALPALESCLELPSKFSLTFGKDAVYVWHFLRWVYFVQETEWQCVMVGAVKRLCDLLGARDCIITNDENPANLAFREGASFQEALQVANRQGEGEVARLEDLYIDEGFADDLAYEGPEGEPVAIPLWDTHGYWRVTPLPGQPPGPSES